MWQMVMIGGAIWRKVVWWGIQFAVSVQLPYDLSRRTILPNWRGCLGLRRWSGLSTNQRAGGSIPVYPIPCAEMSLGKTLKAQWPLPAVTLWRVMEKELHVDALCECADGKLLCKVLWVVIKTRKGLYVVVTLKWTKVHNWCFKDFFTHNLKVVKFSKN